MARIRTIKPEFWTSEKIVECSTNARLMFVGMWNFCDDYGVHPASEKRLKMEVFPSDDFNSTDIRRMIDELLSNGLITEYEIDSERYWHVSGWAKHQNIESPTGRWPMPNGEVGAKVRGRQNQPEYRRSPKDQREIRKNSTNDCGTFAEDSTNVNQKEKEKEKEKEKDKSPNGDMSSAGAEDPADSQQASEDAQKASPCPVKKIVDLYNTILPELPQCRIVTPQREKQIRARWRSDERFQSLEWWEKFFKYVRQSKFLMGENSRVWSADIDFLTTQSKFVLTVEGKYHQEAAA